MICACMSPMSGIPGIEPIIARICSRAASLCRPGNLLRALGFHLLVCHVRYVLRFRFILSFGTGPEQQFDDLREAALAGVVERRVLEVVRRIDFGMALHQLTHDLVVPGACRHEQGAVSPPPLRASTAAPAPSSASTRKRLPACAAQCSGVVPLGSARRRRPWRRGASG